MYFPTSAARQLSSVPALPLPSELVLSIAPSPRKTLFAAVTKTGLTLWRVRVRIPGCMLTECIWLKLDLTSLWGLGLKYSPPRL